MSTEPGGTGRRRVAILTVALIVLGAFAVWSMRAFDEPTPRFCTLAGVVGAPAPEPSPEAAFDAWWESDEGGPAAAVNTYDIGDTGVTVSPPSRSDFERERELRWYWDTGSGGVQVDVEQRSDGWQVGAVNACGLAIPG